MKKKDKNPIPELDVITIVLRKLKDAPNPKHPNNIEDGRIERIVVFKGKFKEPMVSKRFTLIGLYRWFSTGEVQEIIDNKTFRTSNSIYEWEILPNKK